LLDDYESCIMAFEKALVYTEATGYSRMEAFILTGIADVNLELQSYENAQAGYEKALGIAGAIQEHFLQVYILLQQASIAGYTGNFPDGYRLIKLAQESIGPSGSEMESNLCDLEFAALKTMEEKGGEVLKMLENVSLYFKKAGHRAQYDRANIFYIIACIQSNRSEQVIGQMLYLTANLESGAPINGIIAEAAKFPMLLLQSGNDYLQDQFIKLSKQITEFITQIPKAKKFIRENTHRIQLTAPKIFVRSLGKMQVKINEHLVIKSEWQTQAAKNLLFILLAHPEGMTKDEICLIFWPDASPDEARFRFKNTVYRLRKAIGKSCILLEQDYYRFNNKLDYEYDIELFLKELAAASREKDPENKIIRLKAGIKYYGGQYLPEIDEEWVYNLREVLHQNFISALLQLAEVYLGKNQLDLALETCQNALKEDNLLEDTYRLAFRIYASMGNTGGLVRLYQACVETLDREISASPSRQTQELYKNLVK
jgi:LuxR family transcriptional regulator, maltose regulon positive regulatory protein